MTSIEMDSPPTSELSFLDSTGLAGAVPREWTPGLIDLGPESTDWHMVRISINGRPADVSLRRVQGAGRIVAVWERAAAGWYEIVVTKQSFVARHRIQVRPSKIDDDAFAYLLEDLEIRLPVTIALALRDKGARISIESVSTADQTLATQIARLRRAVYGTSQRPGLVAVLNALAGDPHRMLLTLGEWVRRDRVRQPDPAGLVQALWRAGNVTEGRLDRVLDRRVEHTVDLYENQILRAFATEVESHLRMLLPVLSAGRYAEQAEEVQTMLTSLRRSRRGAVFLSEVSDLRSSPSRVTMVLMKRKEYRAAYEGFLEFRRRMSVRLNDPRLAEPLRNLPHLYQLWGTLVVADAVLEAAGEAGFTVYAQRLVTRRAGGLYLEVVPDGKPVLEMVNQDGDRLKLIPERSYGTRALGLHSVSFLQRPDIAIELERKDGTGEVVVLDPKYKLVSDGQAGSDGTPKKEDVDKMHAYRDAIRDEAGSRVVRFAATLYPGTTLEYGEGLAAIRMYPGDEAEVSSRVQRLIRNWLG